ncbi:MAG: hypothetical protein AB8G15_18405, partial [Saprospiraceae bacterium]
TDDLEEAIAVITSPDNNALFSRRLTTLERDVNSGVLSLEEKIRVRNILARDLVDYFRSDRWKDHHKFGGRGEAFTNE